jgi:hypothetical protein
MTALERAVVDIAAALESLRIEYRIIGGIANAILGEPRATIDVDVTVASRIPPEITTRWKQWTGKTD